MQAPDSYAPKMIVLTGPPERIGGQKSYFARNVVVSSELVAHGTTVKAYADQQLSVLARNQEGFRRIETSEIEIAGTTCPLVEAQAQGPGGALYGQLMAYVVRGAMAYTLSASHVLGKPFDAARAEYLEMFRSVELA